MAHEHWPLFDLRVRTPRIELCYPDDDVAVALADLAAAGIHEPSVMPFTVPWTDVEPPLLQRNTLQYVWGARGGLSPDKWDIPLAVFEDGALVGVQGISARRFVIRRAFDTGSWLGRAHQGRGIGKEMRAAVLHLGFDGLGAAWAHTAAWQDNLSSQGVTRALGYEPNGSVVEVRREEPAMLVAFRMSRAQWESQRRDDIEVDGLEPCLAMLGLA